LATAARGRAAAGRRLLALGVHLLAEFLRGLCERLSLTVDLVLVFGLEHALGVLDRRLDLVLLRGIDLVAVFLQRAAHGVYQRLRGVARVDQLERLLFLGRVRLGVLHHALDLLLVETRAR